MTASLPWRPPMIARASAHVTVTPRQADVLTGICHGMTNREIGRRLYLTEDSVKTHVKRLYRSLHARDRVHAVALVMSGQVTVEVAMHARRAA